MRTALRAVLLSAALLFSLSPIAIAPIAHAQTVQATGTAGPVAAVPVVATPAPKSSAVYAAEAAGSWIYVILMAFAVVIAGFVVGIAVKILQGMGVSVTDARKAQLQEIIVNGIHFAASEIKNRTVGRGQVDVKNDLLAKVINYTTAHGADLLSQLGVQAGSDAAAIAITARVERALNDPATPTPPEVTPLAGKPVSTATIVAKPGA